MEIMRNLNGFTVFNGNTEEFNGFTAFIEINEEF
jgi:hypothetical protein